MVTKNCSHEIPYHIMSCSMLITGTKFYPTLFKRRIREYFWDVARNWSGTLLPFFFFFLKLALYYLSKRTVFILFIIYIYIYDNARMISGLKLSSTLPKVANKSWKQKTNQRRPVEAGQKSSDDKVSLFVILVWRKSLQKFWMNHLVRRSVLL